jgi:hypothetical protein
MSGIGPGTPKNGLEWLILFAFEVLCKALDALDWVKRLFKGGK